MDVLQFAIDVLGEWKEEEIAELLENAGVTVLGCAWKARWTEEGYDNGDAPISSD